MKKRKISVGQYNTLYGIVETSLNKSWEELGIFNQVSKLADGNKEITEKKGDTPLPNIYFVYKRHANESVNKILEELDIEVE